MRPKAHARQNRAATGPVVQRANHPHSTSQETMGHLPGSLSSVPGLVQRKCSECEVAESGATVSTRLEVGPAAEAGPYKLGNGRKFSINRGPSSTFHTPVEGQK